MHYSMTLDDREMRNYYQKLNSSRILKGSLSFFSSAFAFSPKLKLMLFAYMLMLKFIGLGGVGEDLGAPPKMSKEGGVVWGAGCWVGFIWMFWGML